MVSMVPVPAGGGSACDTTTPGIGRKPGGSKASTGKIEVCISAAKGSAHDTEQRRTSGKSEPVVDGN